MLAIIGGSGLGEALQIFGNGRVETVSTPFGAPSGPITVSRVDGIEVALLPRHGTGHLLNPSKVPYRANIFALKTLGVTQIIASGAVGSLSEEIAPRSLVIPDQIIDRTYLRKPTFFEDIAAHVELSSPFCSALRDVLAAGSGPSGIQVHPSGTYVCMEGPQLSTRAESQMHRAFGGLVIGMTGMPEARLAREAEICYASVALVTDYDSWRVNLENVEKRQHLEEIIHHFRAATANALELIRQSIPALASLSNKPCSCQSALALGIWSERGKIPAHVWQTLKPLLQKYAPQDDKIV